MEKPKSSYQKGRHGEMLVQKNLWRRNFRVKDVSKISNYDLLVNDIYRVEVKCTTKSRTNVQLRIDKFDVLCLVVIGELSDSIFYLKNKELLSQMKYENKENVFFITPKVIQNLFTKKPQDVFISPPKSMHSEET